MKLQLKNYISIYNHPRILKIKSVFDTDSKFNQPKPTTSDINKIVFRYKQSYQTKWYLCKIFWDVSQCYWTSSIIACDMSENKYSEHAKTATVRPNFKEHDTTNTKNNWLFKSFKCFF